MSDFRIKVQAELDASKLTSQLNELKNQKIPLKVKLEGLDDTSALKSLQALTKKDRKINVGINITGEEKLKSITNELNTLKKLSSGSNKIKIDIGGSTGRGSGSVKDTISDYKLLKNLADEIGKKKVTLAGLDATKNISQIKELESQINKLESDYSVLYKNLSGNLNTSQIGKIEQVLGKSSDKAAEISAKMKDLERNAQNAVKPFNTLDAITASNKTLSWIEKNTKASKTLGNAFEDLAKKQRNATNAEELSGYNKEFKNLVSIAQSKGLTGKSMLDDSVRAFKQIFQFAGMYSAIQNIAFEIPQQIVAAVKDVDSAMTNLYKVTDETEIRYAQFQQTAAKTSQELGRSMSSYITQVSEWSKLGYTMDQSEELAKNSAIYSNVGEVEDTTAVSDMVTAMKAFNIEASNSISIVDSLNKLGNEFAVSSADLGTGLSNSASALSSAGNDINQSLAMLTGMTEITQSAAESGNALKVLSMRVRGYDEETQSYSNNVEELSGKIADLTKTAKTPGGISLFTDEAKTTYKDTYTLLKEISEIYSDLTDKNQARLLETLAGKSRGNQVAALLQAFQSGQVEKAYQASVNSEGSAQQEQDRWMNSIEAKIEKFKASFQELSINALDSDIFKGAIDSGTALVSVLNQIISVGNGIPAILTAISGAAIFKNWD